MYLCIYIFCVMLPYVTLRYVTRCNVVYCSVMNVLMCICKGACLFVYYTRSLYMFKDICIYIEREGSALIQPG